MATAIASPNGVIMRTYSKMSLPPYNLVVAKNEVI